ncbi:hypothetical protein PHMEG_0004624 [Phytophthora megakarya]|uniref:Uncharacterized protein n=1 Tax=Phytophthora megakarya TaxID=4795 RepID=A0A225WTB9_9STRA|nr:hypothetical protein PHMEG_0004624 [Phytophthora megakarya]
MDVSDKSGYTPLRFAVECNHSKLIELLLESGADPTKQSTDGVTDVGIAFQTGNLDAAKIFAANRIQFGDGDEASNLIVDQAKDGHTEMIELLLECGVSVDCENDFGWTPLHWATVKNHVNVVELLLNRKAKVDNMGGIGCTALHEVISIDVPLLISSFAIIMYP